jgi:KUP system potassium uptake protein
VPKDTVPKRAHAAATGSLALGAAGVVFGDIGTSPIYAFRESIAETTTGIDEAALGTASLAIWAVTLVVSVKYLMFVMKASNEGEGGILALLALLARWMNKDGSSRFGSTRLRTLVLLALLAGAALLFGDGALTPAISVLSAVEGVGQVSPALGEYSVIIAVVILVALFAVQFKGTAKIGNIFGPIMVLWFVVIGGLGVWNFGNGGPLGDHRHMPSSTWLTRSCMHSRSSDPDRHGAGAVCGHGSLRPASDPAPGCTHQ